MFRVIRWCIGLFVICFALAVYAEEPNYENLPLPELTQMATAGNARAQFYLGVRHCLGQGVPQDYRQAVNWYQKAAEQGYAPAQFNLGFMYDNGRGVPQDYVLAYALFNLAATNGYKDAAHNRDLIAKEMAPAQIEEGQAIASKWRVGKPLPTTSKTGRAR